MRSSIDDQLLYTDAHGDYLFEGNVIDTKSRRDLSEERRRVLFAIHSLGCRSSWR